MNEATRLGFATALFSLTAKEDLEKTNKALEEVCSLLREVSGFKEFLTSYDISYMEKKNVIENSFSGLEVPNLVPFLCLLAKYHGYDEFDKIVELFSSYADESLGIERGIIFSRFPLDKQEKEKIEAAFALNNKKVKLKNIIDYSLIGGIKVSINGKVYDYSLKNRLDNLHSSLLSGGNSNEN